MRGPTRLHITWLDDTTLKLETDYGIQTRLLQFRARQDRRDRRAVAAGRDHGAVGDGRGRTGTRRTAARIDEVDHHAPAAGLPAQERRALQRQHGVHRVLGPGLPGRTAVSGWWSRTRWTTRRTCRSRGSRRSTSRRNLTAPSGTRRPARLSSRTRQPPIPNSPSLPSTAFGGRWVLGIGSLRLC